MKEFLNDIKDVSESMHSFAHGFRDHMLKLVNDIETIDYRGKDFRDFIRESLNYIADVFSVLTRNHCSACIKLIIPAGGERTENYVYTYERNQNSIYQRKGTDKWLKEYKLSDFTPFKEIQEKGERWCICHDLEKAVNEGKVNVHPGRLPSVFQDYNAYCIVPIRAQEKGKKDPQIIAFLCIDNMYGGFNEKIVYIAAAFADILYYAFLINDMAGDPRNIGLTK